MDFPPDSLCDHDRIAASLATSAGIPSELIAARLGDNAAAAGEQLTLAEAADQLTDQLHENDEATIRAGFSTTDLPEALATVAELAMFAGFSSILDGGLSSALAIEIEADSFKQQHRFSIDLQSKMREMSASGEIQHAVISSTEQTYSVDVSATMLGLSRQAIRNYSAASILAEAGRKFGVAAGRHVEDLVVSGLGDITYDSSNSLSATALDAAGMQAGSILLRSQVSGDVVLDYSATSLIVASDQESNARALTAPGVGVYSDINLVVSNRLDAGVWYLATKLPEAGISPLTVAYLKGRSGPNISLADSRFSVLGSELAASIATGIAVNDERSIVKVSVA